MPQPAPVAVDNATSLTTQAWRYLEKQLTDLGAPLMRRVQPVLDFRAHAEKKPLSRAQRTLIIDQAKLLFESVYAHLPFKQEIYDFARPLETLEETRARLDHLGESEFHAAMIDAFSQVRDAHTLYGLPSPYRGAVAFLPFQMRCVTVGASGRHYFVSRVMNIGDGAGFGHPFFGPGAEILEWNGGEPVDRHVERAAERLPAGNESARFTRGALHSTLRPLTYCDFPFDNEMPAAEILYRPLDSSELRRIRLPWGVARFAKDANFPGTSFSISVVHSETSDGSKRIHYIEDLWRTRASVAVDPKQVSSIPEAFEFQYTGGPQDQPIDPFYLTDADCPEARFGYVRIKQFSDGRHGPGASDALVEEFRRILAILDREAPDGLVVDIRSNPGGDIQAAERMLQMLTPGPITPEAFHLPNTPAMIQALRNIKAALADGSKLSSADSALLSDAAAELGAWLDDADLQPFPHGPDRLTSGRPLTDAAKANEIGQVYQGPVALLIDGLTYSAADIFAAGFQDHRIGQVIGAVQTTGGGGGNVWSHGDLMTRLGPKPSIQVKKLPRDIGMTVALRRCMRVNHNQDQPIEDRGVPVDLEYQPASVEDVLAGMHGMVRFACQHLAHLDVFRLDIANVAPRDDGGVALDVISTNIERVRFFLDGKLALEARMSAGEQKSFDVRPVDGAVASKLRMEGYCGDAAAVRAVRTVVVREAAPDSAGVFGSVRDRDGASVRDRDRGR